MRKKYHGERLKCSQNSHREIKKPKFHVSNTTYSFHPRLHHPFLTLLSLSPTPTPRIQPFEHFLLGVRLCTSRSPQIFYQRDPYWVVVVVEPVDQNWQTLSQIYIILIINCPFTFNHLTSFEYITILMTEKLLGKKTYNLGVMFSFLILLTTIAFLLPTLAIPSVVGRWPSPWQQMSQIVPIDEASRWWLDGIWINWILDSFQNKLVLFGIIGSLFEFYKLNAYVI